jgi:biotin carboxyl carrier protein
MAHDPTSNDSDSTHGMAFATAGDPIAANAKRKSRRKIDLSESDAALIDRTRAQIRELVDEVRRLGQTDCSLAEFNEGMLTRVVMALASVGGAVWIRQPNKEAIELQCHVNLKQTALGDNQHARKMHGKLVERVFEAAQPTMIPPSTRNGDVESGGNPTEHLLIFSPVIVDGQAVATVEIFQRPGAGPATQRGYQKFLSQVCDIAAEFLSRSRMRTFEQQQQTWKQMERFVHQIHRKLDVNDTIYAIANEGRRLIECDRVSVATMHGSRCVVKTVSGLDAIERRSEQVKTLGRLATTVVRSGKPLWYVGDDKNLAPKIEKRVQEHVAKSHTRMTAVIPLLQVASAVDDDDPFARANPAGNEKPVGALIVELLNDATVSNTLKERTELVAAHAQTALSNSIDHQSIFLMPLWKAIGTLALQFQGRRLIRTAIASCLVAAGLAFLCLYPYSFSLGASGNLVPERQHEIYAHIDGILTDIKVSNTGDSIVEKDQIVATMTSSTLDLKIGNIEGQIAQAKNELRIAETGKTTGKDAEEIAAYAFQFERAKQEIANLENELAIQKKDRELLDVRAPIAGQVVNWQVRQNLLGRPVRFGQHLMTIVPHDTQWLIELEMPERRLAHLSRAMENSDEHLKVSFGLLSWPGKEFEGELISVDQKLDVYSDEGNAALMRVRFPNDAIPEELLKSGTRVTGKVHCGSRSVGYAMFYELIETVQSKWQFWF